MGLLRPKGKQMENSKWCLAHTHAGVVEKLTELVEQGCTRITHTPDGYDRHGNVIRWFITYCEKVPEPYWW